jgi:hypothetical protein
VGPTHVLVIPNCLEKLSMLGIIGGYELIIHFKQMHAIFMEDLKEGMPHQS